ncbi:MAG: hypothetical protein E2O56_07215 [Gammaproteobacteria bacterium]|nr:MAG: hypothetical protein E2O56_07215 [Gammaproteobacteria bacterium]
MNLLTELRRRNVFRVAAVYIVTSWLILQIADVLLERFGVPDWGFRFITILLALGFPVAVIFSWVYEITPDGIRKEKDIEHDESITGQTARKLNYMLVGLMVVAVGLLLADRFWPAGDEIDHAAPASRITSAPERAVDGLTSVAVLPFVNMSNDPDNEYFSDGISEELLNVLVRIEGLRVPSRTSSFAFKDKEDMSIRDIARELEVDHVLEGSVRKAGNTVRVTAQLIDVRTDTHLWSDTFDRELEDIFAIQNEIATQIVDALKTTLGADASASLKTGIKPTENLDAYQLYLQGRYLWRQRGEENIRESIELLEKAVALDPEYAEAWGILAVANMTLPYYARDAERTTDAAGKTAAEQALALDATLGEAWAALANVTAHEGDWAGSLDYHRKGAEVAPRDSTGRLWTGLSLGEMGYLEEAREQFEVGHQLDPASGIHNHWLGMAYYMGGREEEALALFERAVALGRATALWGTQEHLLVRGRLEEAAELALSNPEVFLVSEEIQTALADLENPGKTELFFQLMADVENPSTSVFRVVLGDYDGALESLERHARYDDTIYYVMWHPLFAPMRQSPGFVGFAERTGFVELWRERGWPDLCRPVGDSFECD